LQLEIGGAAASNAPAPQSGPISSPFAVLVGFGGRRRHGSKGAATATDDDWSS
jgi:hypothetical protein